MTIEEKQEMIESECQDCGKVYKKTKRSEGVFKGRAYYTCPQCYHCQMFH